jgi:hypothetical protein
MTQKPSEQGGNGPGRDPDWFEEIDLTGLSEPQQTALWGLLKLGNLRNAAKLAGVPREMLREWLESDRRFGAVIKRARELAIATREHSAVGGKPNRRLKDRVLQFLKIV